MESPMVVKVDILPDRLSQIGYRFELFEIKTFVIDGRPKSFHKDVVQSPAFAIH